MQMELGQVLAGLAFGSGKPERQSFIQNSARARVLDFGQARSPRLRDSADHFLQRHAGTSARDSDHRYGGGRWARGQGEDGVVGHRLGR
jgi:hypothetical protein